jgi:transposase-like protein
VPKKFSGHRKPSSAPPRLPVKAPAKPRSSIPPPFEGIQSNTCRNAACSNFGIEPVVDPSRRGKGKRVGDGYAIVGHNKIRGQARLRCRKCGEHASLKSNLGIKEELDRIGAYLKAPPGPSCSNIGCVNHGLAVRKSPKAYYAHGKSPSGSRRWRCKACGSTVTDSTGRRRQRKSYENRLVFELLINKSPIKAIARVADLSPNAVYDKIDFIREQCLAFARSREAELPRIPIRRLQISTDRQDYVINWTDRKDRRNTKLTAVGSADNKTGYVFGMHLNFDPSVEREEIERQTQLLGDYNYTHPYLRRHARLWLELDQRSAQPLPLGVPALVKGEGAMKRVQKFIREQEFLADPEAKEAVTSFEALPRRGMQVHFEYTVHAHFRLLRSLIGNAGRVRMFMDQDDTLRAGCLSAFAGEILAGRADAFFVQIDKTYGVDTRRKLILQSLATYEAFRQKHGVDWDDRRIRLHMIREQLENLGTRKPGWRDRWIKDPQHTLNEPDKAVCWITDRGGYGLHHLAVIISRASLHGIDRYFMQLRRLLSMLERPVHSPSSNRTWHGYSPYNPEMVQKVLDIFRVHYNFVKTERQRKGPDGRLVPVRTPAMKLGLARGQIRIEDILYFNGGRVD